jgi:hypothetical protein
MGLAVVIEIKTEQDTFLSVIVDEIHELVELFGFDFNHGDVHHVDFLVVQGVIDILLDDCRVPSRRGDVMRLHRLQALAIVG